ncbi:MAG: glycosyltransferase family 4 protein [Anaerolineae bacterium]|nr:MAG: glycosyltransferase family 4 protein [Anaerolineae bacterium]
MHALFVTPAFPPFPGGGERYVRSLALNLAQKGLIVTVATSNAVKETDLWQPDQSPPNSFQIEQDGPLRIIRCPIERMPGGFRGLLAWRKIMVLLSALPGSQVRILNKMAGRVPKMPYFYEALYQISEPIDLIHGFNLSWENAMLAGWHYARQQAIPFIVTPFLHTGVAGRDRVSRNSTMDHQIHMLKDASAVHTLTNIEKQALVRHGCEPSRLLNVGSGIDPIPAISNEIIDWVESLSDTPYILFIGRNSYDKGCIHAMEAVLQLNDDLNYLNLLIVGQPTAELSRFLKKENGNRKGPMRIVGVVSEERKHALLEKTLLLLLPSRTDSFGIVILEAWAHGKPVIGARAGGIADVISDGEDGFLVEFGDVGSLVKKIKLLVQDSDLRRALANNGQRKLAEIYNWDRVGDLVLSNYQHILGTNLKS